MAMSGQTRFAAASPFSVMASRSSSNPFAIALALLGVLALVIAIRDSSRRESPLRAAVRPLYTATPGTPSNMAPAPPPAPARAHMASPEDKKECEYDNYVYPEWPKGFNVSVQAAFILGTMPCPLDLAIARQGKRLRVDCSRSCRLRS